MTSDDAPENQGSKTELPAPRQGQSKSERGEFAAIEDPRLERSLKHDRGEFIEDSGDEELGEEDLEWDAEVDVDGDPNDYATAAEWEQRTQSHPKGEGTKWPLGDPIERLKNHLIGLGEWDDKRHEALEKELDELVVKSYKEAESHGTLHDGPLSPTHTIFEDVYVEPDWRLRRQRQDLGV